MQEKKSYIYKIACVALVIAMLACLFPALGAPPAQAATDYSIMRVKLSIGSSNTSYSFTVKGKYYIKEKPELSISAQKYTVKLSGSKIDLYNAAGSKICSGLASVTFVASPAMVASSNLINIKNTSYGAVDYLGEIKWMPYKNSSGKYVLWAINNVYMEDYVAGVIPYEIGESSHIEALKTQAVCARSYAAKSKSSSGSYDVVDTTSDQVYRGYNASNKNSLRAVQETSKQMVMYGGSVVQTFFGASNGGYTESPYHIWNIKSSTSGIKLKPYEKIIEDPYDVRNTSSRQETITITKNSLSSSSLPANLLKYIKKQVEAKGYKTPTILKVNDIIPNALRTNDAYSTTSASNNHARLESGLGICPNYMSYIFNLNVKGTKDNTVVSATVAVDINLLQLEAGANYPVFSSGSLKMFSVEETSSNFYIYYRRYGHGIGMSQRGTQQQAKEGRDYKQILAFYFPGTTLEQAKITPPAQTAKYSTDLLSETKIFPGAIITDVTVREQPGDNYSDLGTLTSGTSVEVINASYSSGWCQIWYKNWFGFIPTSSINVIKNAKPTIITTGSIKSTTATVYNSTGNSKKSIGVLNKGQTINISTPTYASGWHKIWYKNQTGYISASSVTVKSPKIENTYSSSAAAKIYSSTASDKTELGTVEKSKTIPVYKSYNPNASWHAVWYKDRVAYVESSKFICKAAGIKASGKTTKSTPVYSKAETTGTKLGTLASAQSVAIVSLNHTKGWHKVIYNNKIGYVQAGNVSQTKPKIQKKLTTTASGAMYSTSLSSKYTLYTIPKSTAVEIVEQNYISGYNLVWYKNQIGVVATGAFAALPKVIATGTVTASTLNVRKTPSASSTVLASLKKGTKVQITKKNYSSGWHQVLYKNALAYVSSKYIKIN